MAILLHRLFSPRPFVIVFFYFLVISLIVYTIILSPFELTRCSPIEGAWDFEVPAKCWNKWTFTNLCIFTGRESPPSPRPTQQNFSARSSPNDIV